MIYNKDINKKGVIQAVQHKLLRYEQPIFTTVGTEQAKQLRATANEHVSTAIYSARKCNKCSDN